VTVNLRRRPDVYAAEEAVVAADRSLDSARAAMLPQISLTGYAGGAFATVLPTPESFYLVGADALAPIFDSGRRRANADVVAAQRDEAAFSYHMARSSNKAGTYRRPHSPVEHHVDS